MAAADYSTYGGPQYGGARPSKEPDFATYTDFSAITPVIQKHLQKVYLTLASSLLVVAVGAYAHTLFNLGGTLSYIGTLGSVLWLASTPAYPANQSFRLQLLYAVAFFQGCSLGPLLQAVADIDSSIIASAFLATSAVFASFSGAALLAKRREFLFLGGFLGSALSSLLMLRLASWIFGARALMFQLELYGGLLIFAGYVVFDTQVMIERAANGVTDIVHDALQLLLDFVAIFVRILIILTSKERKQRDEERRRDSTKRR